MKTTFLFPGQRSQFTGMGRILAESRPAAHCIFDEADDALDFPASSTTATGRNLSHQLRYANNSNGKKYRADQPDFVAGCSLG